ncbi:MAG: response regulator [Candidatus Eisenbacteria bacterium]|nr:response regulator [Candidatus Eisenbacteria bacterium]
MVQRTSVLDEQLMEQARKRPVLIVEDEDIVRESLRDWLTNSGYNVRTAAEGEEALRTIDRQDVGLLILDLRLPGKSGIEVLREARTKKPNLKGIIITAYPSIQTAVEAGKEGAIDYLPKPVNLNEIETLIRETLTAEAVGLAPAPEVAPPPAPPAPEEPVEEVIAVAPGEVAVHLRQGKALFLDGQYKRALKELEAVLAVVPNSIETRVWIRKAKEALASPAAEPGAEAKPKYCVWMGMGMVSYRVCTNDYNCMTCEFDQEMQEKIASGDTPELDAALARLKALPGNERLCRYALKGDVTHRLCSRLFQCATCEFGQFMEDAIQHELAQRVAELAARQDALRRKEQSWWWPYWQSEPVPAPRPQASSN